MRQTLSAFYINFLVEFFWTKEKKFKQSLKYNLLYGNIYGMICRREFCIFFLLIYININYSILVWEAKKNIDAHDSSILLSHCFWTRKELNKSVVKCREREKWNKNKKPFGGFNFSFYFEDPHLLMHI